MADANALFALKPPRDLLWTPVLANQLLHLPPYGTAEPRANLGRWSLQQRQAVGLLGPVASQPTVAPQLSADRSLVTSEYRGNLALLVAGLFQCIDLVSFLLGELRVRSHQCSFDFVDLSDAADTTAARPLDRASKLHLQVWR